MAEAPAQFTIKARDILPSRDIARLMKRDLYLEVEFPDARRIRLTLPAESLEGKSDSEQETIIREAVRANLQERGQWENRVIRL